MAYGIGMPKMTVEQIAESLGKEVMNIRIGLSKAKLNLGSLYVKLLKLL